MNMEIVSPAVNYCYGDCVEEVPTCMCRAAYRAHVIGIFDVDAG